MFRYPPFSYISNRIYSKKKVLISSMFIYSAIFLQDAGEKLNH